jgi:amino acid transporter
MSIASKAKPVSLVRALGPFMATALVVGTVVGSGIFKKPQEIARFVPNFGLVALVWVLGAALALLGALVLAELGVRYPRSGGNYVFLREGFGPLAGFLYAWVEFWISRSASIAALATIFSESLFNLLRPASVRVGLSEGEFWAQCWLTVAVILALAGVNVLGVRWGGLLQLVITLVKIGSLVGIAVLPFVAWRLAPTDAGVPTPEPDHLLPLLPSQWNAGLVAGLGTAMLGVLWAYHGWMNVTLVAEEVQEPRRNLPRSLFSGTLIVAALYLAANVAYYLIIPGPEMAGIEGTTVAARLCHILLGPVGAGVAAAAVICSVFGALNGNLLVGPRVLYAASADGLAPPGLAAIHPRFRTPARAILVLGVWACLLVLGGAALTRYSLPVLSLGGLSLDVNLPVDAANGRRKPLFDVLTTYAMFGAIIFETMAVASIFPIRMRAGRDTSPALDAGSEGSAALPYRCWGYPFVPACYVFVLGLVLVNTCLHQRTEAAFGAGFIALGVVVYALFRRR